MISAILKYAPDYWEQNYHEPNNQIMLGSYSEEYKQIQFEVKEALKHLPNVGILNIKRVQNVYDLGQFLIRGQLLTVTYKNRTYYEVRMFLAVRKQYLRQVLTYNLDPRRCGMGNNLTFVNKIGCISPTDENLVVVRVLTPDPSASSVTPESSSDYVLDYIVELK